MSVDVSGAFDHIERSRMWRLFIREIGNWSFLHCYKKVLDELLLDIELNFTKVTNVKSRSGSPQGLKVSC